MTLASPSCVPCVQQVFGVLDSPEYSGVTPGVYRPVINDGKHGQANLDSDSITTDARHGSTPPATSSHPTGQMQVNKGASMWDSTSPQCMLVCFHVSPVAHPFGFVCICH